MSRARSRAGRVEEIPEVAMLFEDLPPGVKPEDNDEGARLSLEKLARHLEGAGPQTAKL